MYAFYWILPQSKTSKTLMHYCIDYMCIILVVYSLHAFLCISITPGWVWITPGENLIASKESLVTWIEAMWSPLDPLSTMKRPTVVPTTTSRPVGLKATDKHGFWKVTNERDSVGSKYKSTDTTMHYCQLHWWCICRPTCMRNKWKSTKSMEMNLKGHRLMGLCTNRISNFAWIILRLWRIGQKKSSNACNLKHVQSHYLKMNLRLEDTTIT